MRRPLRLIQGAGKGSGKAAGKLSAVPNISKENMAKMRALLKEEMPRFKAGADKARADIAIAEGRASRIGLGPGKPVTAKDAIAEAQRKYRLENTAQDDMINAIKTNRGKANARRIFMESGGAAKQIMPQGFRSPRGERRAGLSLVPDLAKSARPRRITGAYSNYPRRGGGGGGNNVMASNNALNPNASTLKNVGAATVRPSSFEQKFDEHMGRNYGKYTLGAGALLLGGGYMGYNALKSSGARGLTDEESAYLASMRK